jgi:hypothetical protein
MQAHLAVHQSINISTGLFLEIRLLAVTASSNKQLGLRSAALICLFDKQHYKQHWQVSSVAWPRLHATCCAVEGQARRVKGLQAPAE